MTYAAERWDARFASWIVVSLHPTRAEARARLWELRVQHGRVREVHA